MHAYHRWRIHRPPVHSLRETSLCVKSSVPEKKRKNSISSPRALRHRALEVMHRPGQAPCHLRFLSLTSALAALSHARSRWASRVRCEACSANSRVRGGALTAELATWLCPRCSALRWHHRSLLTICMAGIPCCQDFPQLGVTEFCDEVRSRADPDPALSALVD